MYFDLKFLVKHLIALAKANLPEFQGLDGAGQFSMEAWIEWRAELRYCCESLLTWSVISWGCSCSFKAKLGSIDSFLLGFLLQIDLALDVQSLKIPAV